MSESSFLKTSRIHFLPILLMVVTWGLYFQTNCWANNNPVLKHIGKSEEWFIKTFGKWGMSGEVSISYPHLVRLREGKDYIYSMSCWAFHDTVLWKKFWGGPVQKPLYDMFPVKSPKMKLELNEWFDGKTQKSIRYRLEVTYYAYSPPGHALDTYTKLWTPGATEIIGLINKTFNTKLKTVEEIKDSQGVETILASYTSTTTYLSISLRVGSNFHLTTNKRDLCRYFELDVWSKNWKKKYTN